MGEAAQPCGWRGTRDYPEVYRAISIYSDYGALVADAGGLEEILRLEAPAHRERRRLWRLLATIHRVVRQHGEAERERARG